MSSILDKEVSFYTKITSTKPESKAKLSDILTRGDFKDAVTTVRKIKQTKGAEAYKKAKQEMPVFTVSGIFSGSSAGTLEQHSGLICIDIDKKDNTGLTNFDKLKELIKDNPYVAYCGHSVGGDGYFAIIPISSPEQHKEHFLSLEKAFARCGIKVDTSCKDVSRKRFISYDTEPYINFDAVVYDRVYNAISVANNSIKTKRNDIQNKDQLTKDVLEIIEIVELLGVDITGRYEQWFKIGCALASAFKEDGREMFHKVSEQGESYRYDTADTKYTECLRTKGEVHIGTFFYFAKEAGVFAASDFKEAD